MSKENIKEALNKISSLDEETEDLSQGISFLLKAIGIGLGAGLFAGTIFLLLKLSPVIETVITK